MLFKLKKLIWERLVTNEISGSDKMPVLMLMLAAVTDGVDAKELEV